MNSPNQDPLPPSAKSEIERRLRQIIVRSLRSSRAAEDIVGQDLVAELGVTSIDALEILINVEMEFNIEIHDEDLSASLVSSLSNLATYVGKRIGPTAQG
jgi:acyl carrier protein